MVGLIFPGGHGRSSGIIQGVVVGYTRISSGGIDRINLTSSLVCGGSSSRRRRRRRRAWGGVIG